MFRTNIMLKFSKNSTLLLFRRHLCILPRILHLIMKKIQKHSVENILHNTLMAKLLGKSCEGYTTWYNRAVEDYIGHMFVCGAVLGAPYITKEIKPVFHGGRLRQHRRSLFGKWMDLGNKIKWKCVLPTVQGKLFTIYIYIYIKN